jgi:negative regulator of flagellin synthesis FlgM
MSHKIDGTTPHAPVSAPNRPDARVQSGPAPRRPDGADTVDLTDTARMLQRLETLLASTPVTDRRRVESLRQAVASGAYEIDPDRVAAQVVRLERALYRRS